MNQAFEIVFSEGFKKILKILKRKDPPVCSRVENKTIEIGSNPYCGKPLRNVLKNRWRVQIGSFVLVYSINENTKEIRFLDFDHHDKIYKRYK